jgi:hypothetical protein
MRRIDDTPLDPEIAASLEAIDATLAGDPVDPAHVELAELAVLLAAERPQPPAAFASALDERVQRRFAPLPPSGGKPRKRHRWWLWTPATGLAVALVVAVVIVLGHGPGTSSGGASFNSAVKSASAPAAGRLAGRPRRTSSGSLTANGTSASSAPSSAAATAEAGPVPPSQPIPNGRKIIQGAQLSLTTSSSRIEQVSQELFVVVGQVRGIVKSSTITASASGYAQFQLSIPSGSMPQAMAALSSLRYARVASRTDTTQDVNNQYQADVRRLADDRSLRASLLRQLANAFTQGQIDSLTTRIHDVDAAIARDQATLNGLNNQIDYSQVSVTINGGITPVAVHSGGGGFTLRKAAHDAGRVLTVAAGIALIGLAALVPFALLGALGWWIAAAIRRRRRQQALDLV